MDAVFLDIHMPAVSGLDIARAIARSSQPPAVVFVTADEDCALEAFELAAVDYLLKPVRAERLARSRGAHQRTAADGGAAPEMITVDQGGTTRMIRRDDVTYVQAQGDYARLHTAEASYLIRVPLADLEQQWAEAGFIRTHRSYLVALKHVTSMKLAADGPSVTVAGRRAAHQPPPPAHRPGEARGHPDPAAVMTRVRVTAPRSAARPATADAGSRRGIRGRARFLSGP